MSLIDAKDPLRSASASVVIGDRQLDVLCASFCDRDFVTVTQFKKLGTLVSVAPSRVDRAGSVSYDTCVIMGKDELEHHVFARAIGEVVYNMSKHNSLAPAPSQSGKPLLCCLALTDFSPSVLSKVCDLIKQCNVWS